jgi:hypothetical protein
VRDGCDANTEAKSTSHPATDSRLFVELTVCLKGGDAARRGACSLAETCALRIRKVSWLGDTILPPAAPGRNGLTKKYEEMK